MVLPIIICLFPCAFFCGAIPTGYILMKAVKHQDIRKIGSGNIGSTNVERAAGAGLALMTQCIDIAKGLFPVAIALALSRHVDFGSGKAIIFSAVALAAIAGHDFSPFLGFHGGKGVNTTIGAFLLIAPIAVIVSIGIFYLLRFITPIVSIRSLALGVTLAIMTRVCGLNPAVVYASWIAALLIIFRHIDNIQRLLKGTEKI
jgi:acyl phosphate:glycerol-3-phosphate acyltransferase